MAAEPPAPEDESRNESGKKFSVPGYRVLGPVGRGGVSTVYLAVREADQLKVAIKLLDGRLQHTQNFLPRFIREQQIISRLDSPSVVRILDHGLSDAFVYIVMEYLEGDDLSHYIRLGLRPRQVLAVTYQTGLALRIIHSNGVIHRDIKPTNLMFRRDGTLVLVDFGFSKMAQDDPGLTRQGQVLGTPQYMSPEQARGLPMDTRTDLYSLGVVLYEMLTRRKLYIAGRAAPFDTRDKAPLPLLPQNLSAFQMLLEKLLARRAQDRFPTADAMLDYITRVWGVPRARILEFAER